MNDCMDIFTGQNGTWSTRRDGQQQRSKENECHKTQASIGRSLRPEPVSERPGDV